MKKRLCVIVCLIWTACMLLSAGQAAGAAGYQQVYLGMLDAFESGNYANAYIAAKQVYEAAPDYQEIVSYYQYLTALQEYLPKGEYAAAREIFQTLALRKFQKSEGYAAYALGCQYEDAGDYTSALEQFREAYSKDINEAFGKIQECQKKSSDVKYSQAAALADQKNYLAAAVAFEALVNDYTDAREKANECYYLAAEELSRQGDYAAAADLFTGLGTYKDSAQKAKQNRAWASGGIDTNKLGLRLEDSTSTSLSLKWDDETALGAFTVTYMPTGIESLAVTMEQNDTSVTIEGLLPNTQYTVSVSSPVNSLYFEKNNYWTAQAAPVTDYNVSSVRILIHRIDRMSVSRLENVEDVINTSNDPERCMEISEDGYRIPDRKPGETNYDLYVSLYFFADMFEEPQEAEITCIVRLDRKMSVGKTEIKLLPVEGYKGISANVTDLMDILYENTGLNGSELTFDFYLNGQQMGTKTIAITH